MDYALPTKRHRPPCWALTPVSAGCGPAGRGPTEAHPMAEPDEADLLLKAQNGDRTAFGQLVVAHQRRVFACAVQMLGDFSEAEDAVQEAFLRAWRALARFDGRSELSTWLYRICVNVCLNTLRRRRRTKTSNLADPRVPEIRSDPSQDPEAAAQRKRYYQRLVVALDTLSPSLRTTVVLVLMQGMPHKQAAEVLGCPEGTVAWRIHEARRRLRDHMAEDVSKGTTALQGGRVAS